MKISEFYGIYIEPEDMLTLEKYKKYEFLLYEEEFIKKPAESLSNIFKNVKILSRNQLKYIGFENEIEYFKKVIIYMALVFIVLLFMGILDENIIGGLINGIIGSIIVLILSIFYPKLRLILFRGEIKLQVLFALLYMISILRAGASLPEVLERISKSNEYGIVAFETRTIIKDNISGYSLAEALERAKLRTEIPLLKKLYDQMIIGYNKGNLPLLLEKLYEDIVRESMVKLDSSKFMIQNLGNLVFGVGLILPFSGMILSTMIANQGFTGILNTLDLLLTKIGPLLTLIFGIFVKLKVE
ncbi:Type II secretion system F domain protein [Methanocaldococcus bathoardescens]|uniref:Type II secretion system F domain protein n=2 Tax=Methanocaldococcus bathoardescens TaxID=1301915 RepID=A0A076LHL2_9EURY|nr:Type II secretion system F domain protein [Methanocaldococcus bathoardescens]